MFPLDHFDALAAEWEQCCARVGTNITNLSPWIYFHKHMLSIATELHAMYTTCLVSLHLPDVTVLLTVAGREVARQSGAVSHKDMDAAANIALMQMHELTLVPGLQVTVNASLCTLEGVATHVDELSENNCLRCCYCTYP